MPCWAHLSAKKLQTCMKIICTVLSHVGPHSVAIVFCKQRVYKRYRKRPLEPGLVNYSVWIALIVRSLLSPPKNLFKDCFWHQLSNRAYIQCHTLMSPTLGSIASFWAQQDTISLGIGLTNDHLYVYIYI